MCLAALVLNTAWRDTAGETTPRTASKETGGQWRQCWPDHHTLSMSSGGPSARMCLLRERLIPAGRSHGGHVHTYWWAGFSATCRLVRTISISRETRRQHMFSLRPCASPITPPTHPPHSLTYLFIALARTHTRSGTHSHPHSKTPHRTRDCSKTTLYSYEEASALSVCVSHMNTK